APEVDLGVLARVTPGFSGADLANLANEAAMMAARRTASTIDRTDFDAALDKILMGTEREPVLSDREKHRVAVHQAGHPLVAALAKILIGTERELVLSDREKHRVAVHEGGHALVAALTRGADPPRRISIIPRGMALGATQQRPENDRFLVDAGELEARLRVLL